MPTTFITAPSTIRDSWTKISASLSSFSIVFLASCTAIRPPSTNAVTPVPGRDSATCWTLHDPGAAQCNGLSSRPLLLGLAHPSRFEVVTKLGIVHERREVKARHVMPGSQKWDRPSPL